MKFLVLAHKHLLLPLAWRLKAEGHEVQVAQVASKDTYARAWEGRFESFLTGVDKVSERSAEAVKEAATEADATVLTNSLRWTEVFAGYPKLYGVLPHRETPPVGGLWVGGWFDGGLTHAPHLLVEDMGAWTGGQGPHVPAAATLVRLEDSPWLWVLHREEDYLKSHGFKGLVSVAVMVTPTWEVQPIGMVAGWRPLHTQLFVSEQDPWADTFDPQSLPVLPKPFVVGAVVSIPPWPNRPAAPIPPVPIEINAKQPSAVRQNVFFHDMRIEGEQPCVVGLDGMVAVTRGAGTQLATARVRCQIRCNAIHVPQRQFRADAGVGAERLLTYLDDNNQLGQVLG